MEVLRNPIKHVEAVYELFEDPGSTPGSSTILVGKLSSVPYKDRAKQKKFQRLWQAQYARERRLQLFKLLGGSCVDCGTTDFRVIQFDHKVPLRRVAQRCALTTGNNLVRRALKCAKVRKLLEVRCANCHQIKSFEDRVLYRNYKG